MESTTGHVPLLNISGISKRFGGLWAIRDFRLSLSRGDRCVVIGPNGAGKTTLFRIISGEFLPTTGRILFGGRDITRLPAYVRAHLGIGRTYQITTLFNNLTVLENLILALLGTKQARYVMYRPTRSFGLLVEQALALLDRIGLTDRRELRIAELSYGEQRQLEVLMALASAPSLLLLDEPTAGLSPGEVGPMVRLLKSLDPGTTLLLIEHDMDVAFELGERFVVLHQGRVVAEGSGREIRSNPKVQEIYLGAAA